VYRAYQNAPGLGFMVWDSEFLDSGSWYRFHGLGFRVQGLEFEVWGLEFEVWDLGFGVSGFG